MFKKGLGNWTQYRDLEPAIKLDLHYAERGRREIPYESAMAKVQDKILETIKRAYDEGYRYVLITHGHSTSRPGKTTARSQVRKLMRSKEVTPYIRRSECIQHESVFVVAIRS